MDSYNTYVNNNTRDTRGWLESIFAICSTKYIPTYLCVISVLVLNTSNTKYLLGFVCFKITCFFHFSKNFHLGIKYFLQDPFDLRSHEILQCGTKTCFVSWRWSYSPLGDIVLRMISKSLSFSGWWNVGNRNINASQISPIALFIEPRSGRHNNGWSKCALHISTYWPK